jgi:hypothetical protein
VYRSYRDISFKKKKRAQGKLSLSSANPAVTQKTARLTKPGKRADW